MEIELNELTSRLQVMLEPGEWTTVLQLTAPDNRIDRRLAMVERLIDHCDLYGGWDAKIDDGDDYNGWRTSHRLIGDNWQCVS